MLETILAMDCYWTYFFSYRCSFNRYKSERTTNMYQPVNTLLKEGHVLVLNSNLIITLNSSSKKIQKFKNIYFKTLNYLNFKNIFSSPKSKPKSIFNGCAGSSITTTLVHIQYLEYIYSLSKVRV